MGPPASKDHRSRGAAGRCPRTRPDRPGSPCSIVTCAGTSAATMVGSAGTAEGVEAGGRVWVALVERAALWVRTARPTASNDTSNARGKMRTARCANERCAELTTRAVYYRTDRARNRASESRASSTPSACGGSLGLRRASQPINVRPAAFAMHGTAGSRTIRPISSMSFVRAASSPTQLSLNIASLFKENECSAFLKEVECDPKG